MARITDPRVEAAALPGETPWEWTSDDQVAYQRECPDCEHGLLYAPARFCARCGGNGTLVRIAADPRQATS